MSPKVQSYLYLVLTIVAGAGPKIVEALAGPLPEAAHIVSIIVMVCSAIQSARSLPVLQPNAKVRASLRVPPVPVLMLTICLACVAWLSAYQAACTPGQSAAPIVAPSVDFAVCVLGTAAEDIAAGKTAAQVVEDAIAKCGGDAVAVGQVLDAHKNAEIREGCVNAAKVK